MQKIVYTLRLDEETAANLELLRAAWSEKVHVRLDRSEVLRSLINSMAAAERSKATGTKRAKKAALAA